MLRWEVGPQGNPQPHFPASCLPLPPLSGSTYHSLYRSVTQSLFLYLSMFILLPASHLPIPPPQSDSEHLCD